MGKKQKRILAFFIISSVILTLVITASVLTLPSLGNGTSTSDNNYGGKTYMKTPLYNRGHYVNKLGYGYEEKSVPLPKQFPSDKIPVLGECKARDYSAAYDKNDNLITANLYMHTKRSSKETFEDYKNFYSKEVRNERIRINEYEEALTYYELLVHKDKYRYKITVSRRPGKDFSDVNVNMWIPKN